MRERVVVPDEPLEAARVVRLEHAHGAFESRLSRAEEDEADPAPEQLGRGLEEEVVALLRDEAADGADDHRRIARLEAREPAELAAAVELPAQVLGRVARGEVRVDGRVPLLAVDAVQDPGEAGGFQPEDAVEACAPLGRADLPRVGG